MVSLFYARRYPAGREVTPGDQSVPYGEQLLSAYQNCAVERKDAEMIGLEQICRFR